MIKTPIYQGLLQSNLDFAGFIPVNLTGWPPGGGSGGPNVLITANVKDAPYSAVGNGVADDSVAINSAIAAVISGGGGTVFFPKGIYLCNGAFDASFNCILKIPNPATPVTVELIGEEHPPWGVFTTFDLSHASTIRTTKTGTGTGPALLAGSQARGTGRVADYTTMSNALVKIRNLNFILPNDPSLHGVRLDGVGQAFVENSNVMVEAQNTASAFTQPTHGTTGLWMPNAINFSMNWVKHVTVTGFDTGFMTGEHLRAPFMQAFNCINGVSFLEAMYPSWANIQLGNCVEGIRFIGQHTVDLMVETEHAPSGWQSASHDIKDASNFGSGVIQCYVGSGFPPADTFPAIDGGTGLQIIDMFNRTIILPATGSFNGKVTAPSVKLTPANFANLPASPTTGQMACVADATTGLAWGANVTVGGSTGKYLIWWQGSSWTVAGK